VRPEDAAIRHFGYRRTFDSADGMYRHECLILPLFKGNKKVKCVATLPYQGIGKDGEHFLVNAERALMRENVPSRRQMLGGAALGVAGLVVFPAGGAGVRLSHSAPARKAAATTSPGIPVGVTLNMSVFPRGTSMAAALAEWAKATGCQPLSTKVYLGHRQFPTGLGNDKIHWCAATGGTAILCYEPSWNPFSKADAAALEHSLASLKSAGLHHAAVVLWTEPQGSKRHLSADQFKAGFRFYGAAARSAGWPLYSCMNGSAQSQWAEYLPDADGYALDDYASRGNWKAIWGPGGIATMADRDGKKFGWFEMGASASKPVTQATVTAYLTDARDYLASRKPGTTGPVTWYNGAASEPGGLANTLVPVGHRKGNGYILTLYSRLYRAVAPQ
jgi:hypothetical protein